MTVTAAPEIIGYDSARELLDAAVAAGLSCRNPSAPGANASLATDQLACKPYLEGSHARVYATSGDLQRDVDLFTKLARFDIKDGREPDSLLRGEHWMVTGSLQDLSAIAPSLDGQVLDLTAVATPKPSKRPAPPKLARTIPGDGTFLVGTDIAAGTYRNEGPSPNDGRSCVVYASTKPSDLGTYLRGSTSKGPAFIEVREDEYVTTFSCKPFAFT